MTDCSGPAWLSVVICTRDRPNDLHRCLAALARDSVEHRERDIEVVVVDNGSSPPVRVRPDDYTPLPLRLVVEPRPGLSVARNRGVREAAGEVVLFLDDDATACPGLLGAYLSLRDDPTFAAAGGPIHLVWPGAAPPRWLHESVHAMYSALDLGPDRQDLLFPEAPYGANLAIRRDVALAHPFASELGRRGRSLQSGEESDVLLRIAHASGRVVWLPDAAVDHHLHTDRTRLRWLLRRAAAQGSGEVRFFVRRSALLDLPVPPSSAPGELVREAVLRGWRRTLSPRNPVPPRKRVTSDLARRTRLLAAARAGYRELPAVTPPQVGRPRVVATLVACDEVDVIEAWVRYHLDLGIDQLLVTDHGSTDGTRAGLHELASELPIIVVHQESPAFDQARYVTRMARHAAMVLGANWVVHLDADEFLCVAAGSLHEHLAGLPAGVGIVEMPIRDAVLRPDDARPFYERMTVRTAGHRSGDARWAPPKVLHRAHLRASVSAGNHRVRAPGLGASTQLAEVGILHYPLRSKAQLERKYVGGAARLDAVGARAPAKVGQHWREGAARIEAGQLDALHAEWLFDDERIAAGLADGSLVVDAAVRDSLRRVLATPALY